MSSFTQFAVSIWQRRGSLAWYRNTPSDTGSMQRAWIDSGKFRETCEESNDRETGTFYRIHIFADGIGVLYRRCAHVLWRMVSRIYYVGSWDVVWRIGRGLSVVLPSKRMIIPGTEDLVDAYHDYWHHIKYAVIGMFSQAVIALPVGLLVMWLSAISTVSCQLRGLWLWNRNMQQVTKIYFNVRLIYWFLKSIRIY